MSFNIFWKKSSDQPEILGYPYRQHAIGRCFRGNGRRISTGRNAENQAGDVVMCTKFLKFAVTLVIGFLAIGGIVFGRYFASYAHTTTRCVQESVRQAVPLEFELQRARDMINQVIPELRANIRTIAREEVEVDRLEAEVVHAENELQSRRQIVTDLKDKFEVQQVSYVIDGQDTSRQQLAERLASQFEQYKRSKSIVTSKTRLLETRRKSLQAAQLLLERTRSKKGELEQQIEALVAQHRLVKAQSASSDIHIDDSQLGRAEELMADLSIRLETARRVLDHEMDFYADEIPVEMNTSLSEDLLAEIEEQFGESPEIVASTN
jgi:hypothetical protein